MALSTFAGPICSSSNSQGHRINETLISKYTGYVFAVIVIVVTSVVWCCFSDFCSSSCFSPPFFFHIISVLIIRMPIFIACLPSTYHFLLLSVPFPLLASSPPSHPPPVRSAILSSPPSLPIPLQLLWLEGTPVPINRPQNQAG